MAAMTTALTEFSDSGNSRTYTTAGHTAFEPRLVLQKRRVPSGNQTIAEDTITVVSSTEDSAGEILPDKIAIEVKVRRPMNGLTADVDAALVIARDIIAGDEFGVTVNTQNWLS